MAIDLDKIAAGVNPSGVDPEIEKKANEYGRRSWTMDMYPVLQKVLGEDLTPQLEAKLQRALLAHKIEVLENSVQRAEENKEQGKIW